MYNKQPSWPYITSMSGIVWSSQPFQVDDEVIPMLESIPEVGKEYYVLLSARYSNDLSKELYLLYTPADSYMNSLVDCPESIKHIAVISCSHFQIISQDEEEMVVKVTVKNVTQFIEFEKKFAVTRKSLIEADDGTLLSEIRHGSFTGYGNSIIMGDYGILEIHKEEEEETETLIMKHIKNVWHVLMYTQRSSHTDETFIGNNALDTEMNLFMHQVLENCNVDA